MVQNVEQSLLLLVTYRLQTYHCVQLNALFCCLWHNVEASCHKHFFVFPAINIANLPLTTSD